jgi:phage shock protein C
MSEDPGRAPDRRQLQRPREGRIFGGVCAAIAQHFGVPPVVVRLAAVGLGILSAGVALLGYVTAWVLIPPAEERRTSQVPPAGETTPPAAATGAREAWHVVAGDLRTLAGELRPRSAGEQGTPAAGTSPEPGAGTGAGRGPVGSVDAALTALGERVRDPQVHADARRAAADLSTAVTASVDEIGRRGRRTDDGS